MTYLLWLSRTAPAVWARESESIWAYPTILFLHTLGLGVLVGFTTAIDFRILGFSSSLPLVPMGRFFRLVWIGFWINALSGTALLVMAPFLAVASRSIDQKNIGILALRFFQRLESKPGRVATRFS